MSGLLVVAGEASGDRAAAGVVGALGGAESYGLGGLALSSAGTELVTDLRELTALGVGEVAAKALTIATARSRILRAARKRRPQAALLVNYTEFNALLAPVLHAQGIRVLWYIAPQIWAWRPGRAKRLRRFIDRMAVILPFEEHLWREQGVDAHYVGHPARETTQLERDAARRALGLTPYAVTVAILPGSRPDEVNKLLRPMLEAYERILRDRASIDARVILAPSLDENTRRRALALAQTWSVRTFDADAHAGAAAVLPAFDVALCASGTAALEAVLARAVPVVAYRVGLLTELLASPLLKTHRIALPNILLKRTVFTEVLQREARPARIAAALVQALDHRSELLEACDEVETLLGGPRFPSREVAKMLSPWLTS